MPLRDRIASILLLRIRKRPHSPAPLALLPIGGCLSACAMSLVLTLWMPLWMRRGVYECVEVFMNDFTMYGSSFDVCLDSLEKVLNKCTETNLVLNFEKCHFMVEQGIV